MKKFFAVVTILSLLAVALWSSLNWNAYHDA